MNYYSLLLPTLILSGVPTTSIKAKNTARPNVILILTDDQGYGDVECNGNPYIKTPNYNRLHNEGVYLTDFHTDALSAPTRAALMSGKYSPRTGVWATIKGRNIMHADQVTMAECFQQGGYSTALFGKWHLGENYPYRPMDRGFDEAYYHGGGVIGEAPDYWNNTYFGGSYLHNGEPEQTDRFCTDYWFDKVIEYTAVERDNPFFVYLPLNAAHDPFDVDERYFNHYLEAGVPLSAAKQYGLIENIDENLGRLRDHLAKLDIEDNTLIIIMGDNGATGGYNVYNAGMRDKKGQAYDGANRNFCFIYWKDGGIVGGREIETLSSHIDLLPTLGAICGFEHPNAKDLDGVDISPIILGKKSGYDYDRVICVNNQQLYTPRKYKDMQVMTSQYRLTRSQRDNILMLTDIKRDPSQSVNLIDSLPDVASRLKEEYEHWWEHISERFDEVAYNYIGGEQQRVTLTCHSWHDTKEMTYGQIHVREGVKDNGYLPVRACKSGRYRFRLSRWPEEAQTPICAGLPAVDNIPYASTLPQGVALDIKSISCKIGDLDQTKEVKPTDKYVDFEYELAAGDYKLETLMLDSEGVNRGAYYVYIEEL